MLSNEEALAIVEERNRRAIIFRKSKKRRHPFGLTPREILSEWEAAHGKLSQQHRVQFLTNPYVDELAKLLASPVRLAIRETPKLKLILQLADLNYSHLSQFAAPASKKSVLKSEKPIIHEAFIPKKKN